MEYGHNSRMGLVKSDVICGFSMFLFRDRRKAGRFQAAAARARVGLKDRIVF